MSENLKEIVPTSTVNSGKSTTIKELFIVDTEIPVGKNTKVKTYLAIRVDKFNYCVEINGFDISTLNISEMTLKECKSYQDAINLAKDKESEILTFPWHRIISIKTMKYKLAI